MKKMLNEWKGFLNEQSQEKDIPPHIARARKKHEESRPERIKLIYGLLIQALETYNRGELLDRMPTGDLTDKTEDALMKAAIITADEMALPL